MYVLNLNKLERIFILFLTIFYTAPCFWVLSMLLFVNLVHYLKLLHTILCIQCFFTGGHLSCFHSCLATNSAGMNILPCAPSGRTHKGSGYTHSSFHQILPNYFPASPHWFSWSLTFLPALDVRFLIFGNLMFMNWYLLVSLIPINLITNEVEHRSILAFSSQIGFSLFWVFFLLC